MEVAGVVLGAVPIILFALDNYQRAWGPVKDFWHWQDTIGTIRNNIFLQKRQLDVTLESLGLRDPTWSEVEAALRVRHPDYHERFLDIIREMDRLVNQVLRNLDVDVMGQPKWTDDAPERANWEWRRVKRSFGRRERKSIFEQLRDWNLALQNCGLEKREISSDSENQFVNGIRGSFDEKQCRRIRANAQALHRALQSVLGCTCSYSHRGNIELNWHGGKPLAATRFNIAFSARKVVHGEGGTADPWWKLISMGVEEAAPLVPGTEHVAQAARDSSTTLSPPTATPMITSSITPAKQSWRLRFALKKDDDGSKTSSPLPRAPSPASSASSTSSASTLVPSRPPTPTLSIRLCKLLQSLQEGGQSIPAYLFVPDSSPGQTLRIDHATISNANAIRQTVHLNSLLSRHSISAIHRRLPFTRKQRFSVAAALVWAVLHLCDSPWLGKNLKNEEIQLFLEGHTEAASEYLLSNPYLSLDFSSTTASNKATEAAADTSTAAPSEQFHHGQIRNMTLFTLAIRLIELGRDRPFTRLRQEYRHFGPSTAASATIVDDFEIAKYYILELYEDPGQMYANAADRCLKFLFPGPEHMNNFEHSSFRSTFFADVVAPVQATYDLIPASCAPHDF